MQLGVERALRLCTLLLVFRPVCVLLVLHRLALCFEGAQRLKERVARLLSIPVVTIQV
jgi:hypothetical protein